jgi:hypothetical protein
MTPHHRRLRIEIQLTRRTVRHWAVPLGDDPAWMLAHARRCFPAAAVRLVDDGGHEVAVDGREART